MSEEDDKKALSRRDFLRRAGKEAVDTGTKIVPGGNLARKALGMESASAVPWWNVLAKWRGRNAEAQESTPQEQKTEEQDTGTNNG